MIQLGRHEARPVPSALALRFSPPQLSRDSADYLALFPRLAAHDCAFVLFSDLRGFHLDHQGEVAQNLAAKASRQAFAARIRALVLMSDHPSERQRATFANFWSIPVEVHDDISAATRAFLGFHDRLIP
ncbi:hypothetical protein [Frigidibacter mobilis]|uniref:Uncharacterized protein n=1 Tax=Frigidibacter mobilis TaxID=1335048 RepID=A0A159Z2A9_9RHOB|nr:hypothetical protein [Frigidibacter mobilis]AMY68248.1 hypothetical protein AKL17_0989 [Frigidibacter mobilis]